jgi:predicted hotdog family 3-hydroxylacyl-ACP dehydratase
MAIEDASVENVLLEHDAICAMIPHAGTMCLLDAVLSWDDHTIVCRSHSHHNPHHPLGKNGKLSAIHAVEYAAQAMAVHGGLLARTKGEHIKPGYLAALKDVCLHVEQLHDVPQALTVKAEQLMAQGGNLMYTLEVTAGKQMIATARATVVTQSQS